MLTFQALALHQSGNIGKIDSFLALLHGHLARIQKDFNGFSLSYIRQNFTLSACFQGGGSYVMYQHCSEPSNSITYRHVFHGE